MAERLTDYALVVSIGILLGTLARRIPETQGERPPPCYVVDDRVMDDRFRMVGHTLEIPSDVEGIRVVTPRYDAKAYRIVELGIIGYREDADVESLEACIQPLELALPEAMLEAYERGLRHAQRDKATAYAIECEVSGPLIIGRVLLYHER